MIEIYCTFQFKLVIIRSGRKIILLNLTCLYFILNNISEYHKKIINCAGMKVQSSYDHNGNITLIHKTQILCIFTSNQILMFQSSLYNFAFNGLLNYIQCTDDRRQILNKIFKIVRINLKKKRIDILLKSKSKVLCELCSLFKEKRHFQICLLAGYYFNKIVNSTS